MKTELAIIGAGPAGMAAAEVAIDCGLDVTVVDEQPVPGGQIYRQPPSDFKVSNWLSGRAYRTGKALLKRVSRNRKVHWLMQSTVTGIMPLDANAGESRFTLLVDGPYGTRPLAADAVLVAPGCYDLPAIFPGWNLPGVMAAGGIQAFVKSQQFIPGNRFLFVGSHPLQLVAADQILQAGGEVAGVCFAQSQWRAWEMLKTPGAVLQNLDKFAQVAAALWRLRRAGVPIVFNRTLLQANGEDVLRSVATAPIGPDGKIRRDKASNIDCDRLGVCFGFLASSELARQSGTDCTWDAARGGWIARHDEWMCSTVPGLYVAGEITGVAGAEVAAQEGRLAAIGCAVALGKIPAGRAREMSRVPRRQLRRLNRFAGALSTLSWPGIALLDQLVSEEVTLCKCEEVTVGAILNLLQQNPHVTTASAAKLLSRTGMGLCQGRYCHFALTMLMARRLEVPEYEIGNFTCRFPAKPVLIDALIGPEV